MEVNMNYKGIIIFGEMGSGKDTLADFIIDLEPKTKKYGLGDIIRGMKPIVSISPEWLGNERGFFQLVADKLREIDMNILNKYALSRMITENAELHPVAQETKWDDIYENLNRVNETILPMIVGGRTKDDFDFWKKAGFLIVGITATKENRFQRLVERDGEEVAKNSNPNHNTEKEVAVLVEKADFIANNDGSLEDLKVKAQEVLDFFRNSEIS
jgi:dephospho-CoA kinase